MTTSHWREPTFAWLTKTALLKFNRMKSQRQQMRTDMLCSRRNSGRLHSFNGCSTHWYRPARVFMRVLGDTHMYSLSGMGTVGRPSAANTLQSGTALPTRWNPELLQSL